MSEEIIVKNAHLNNLKNLNLKIPKNKITVFCGISGSGKSTLVFDTIFKEGQRRYLESLSSYARQHLDYSTDSSVDEITGLSPSIAIDQKTIINNPRSTVGTQTEITDYFRVLFSKISKNESKNKERAYSSKPKLFSEIINLFNEENEVALAVLKTEAAKLIPGQISNYKLLNKNNICIDSFNLKKNKEKRFISNITFLEDSGFELFFIIQDKKTLSYSTKSKGGFEHRKLPTLFSFNSPKGACPRCKGLGEENTLSIEKLFDNPESSILSNNSSFLKKINHKIITTLIENFIKSKKLEDLPFHKYSKKIQKELIEGSNDKVDFSMKMELTSLRFKKRFPGLRKLITDYKLNQKTEKKSIVASSVFEVKKCGKCDGKRLNNDALSYKINNKDISYFQNLSIKDLYEETENLSKNLTAKEKIISEKVLKQVKDKLLFLNNIGLGYLTLDRKSTTLSGGETQRVRLANQIGSKLSGILYVLDEPTIGLHPVDNNRLMKSFKELKSMNNTLLIVEHDEETIKSSDHVIEIGPLAGKLGGEIVFNGSYKEFLKDKNSITSRYITCKKEIYKIPKNETFQSFIELKNVEKHNLNSINVKIPIGSITCVTGPSGSGKSTLIHSVLYPYLKSLLRSKKDLKFSSNNLRSNDVPQIENIVELTQKPIGRSSKSNPATYVGIWDKIRDIYASLPLAKQQGFTTSHFSFNLVHGRCENCEGHGEIRTEMQFLPDVFSKCNSCNGLKFKKEVLQIKYKGYSIGDILNLSISEALGVFKNHKKLNKTLTVMKEIGLGYLKIGQSSLTLSGGEAQRVKLAKQISKFTRGHTLYLLDEPSAGLHYDDVSKLLKSLDKLKGSDCTIIIIEHNSLIIKNSDYVIDLGPKGGNEGGNIIFQGKYSDFLKCNKSVTARFL